MPSPLKPPCASRTGQWQQDKVLRDSLATKEQKIPIGMGRSRCVKKAAGLGEQTAERTISSALLQPGRYENYIYLYWNEKHFVAPKRFEHNFLYCSQLPLMLT